MSVAASSDADESASEAAEPAEAAPEEPRWVAFPGFIFEHHYARDRGSPILDQLLEDLRGRDGIRGGRIIITYGIYCSFGEPADRVERGRDGPWSISEADLARVRAWADAIAERVRAVIGAPVDVELDERIVVGPTERYLSYPGVTFGFLIAR